MGMPRFRRGTEGSWTLPDAVAPLKDTETITATIGLGKKLAKVLAFPAMGAQGEGALQMAA